MQAAALEKNKTEYLARDRSVKIQEHLEKKEKLAASGLENIEIRTKAKEMGKDDFLKLLITQLTHQDPTNPVNDQDFIAQMAQFSSLEQMNNMSSNLGKLSDRMSADMVGKYIMGKDSLSGNDVAGVAEALVYDESGDPYLKVGKHAVNVSAVSMVSRPEYFEKAENPVPSAPAGSLQGAPVSPEARAASAAYESNAVKTEPAEKHSPKEGFRMKF